jgi:hypothetical protein
MQISHWEMLVEESDIEPRKVNDFDIDGFHPARAEQHPEDN